MVTREAAIAHAINVGLVRWSFGQAAVAVSPLSWIQGYKNPTTCSTSFSYFIVCSARRSHHRQDTDIPDTAAIGVEMGDSCGFAWFGSEIEELDGLDTFVSLSVFPQNRGKRLAQVEGISKSSEDSRPRIIKVNSVCSDDP